MPLDEIKKAMDEYSEDDQPVSIDSGAEITPGTLLGLWSL